MKNISYGLISSIALCFMQALSGMDAKMWVQEQPAVAAASTGSHISASTRLLTKKVQVLRSVVQAQTDKDQKERASCGKTRSDEKKASHGKVKVITVVNETNIIMSVLWGVTTNYCEKIADVSPGVTMQVEVPSHGVICQFVDYRNYNKSLHQILKEGDTYIIDFDLDRKILVKASGPDKTKGFCRVTVINKTQNVINVLSMLDGECGSNNEVVDMLLPGERKDVYIANGFRVQFEDANSKYRNRKQFLVRAGDIFVINPKDSASHGTSINDVNIEYPEVPDKS